MKILTLLIGSWLILTPLFAEVVPLEIDVANHAVLTATATKFISAFGVDTETTVLVVMGLSVLKEVLDLDKTGFSLNDLVYDGLGIWLIKGELKF